MMITAGDIASGAAAPWEYLASVLTAPSSGDDCERLIAVLDEVLDAGDADETSPLATLAERIYVKMANAEATWTMLAEQVQGRLPCVSTDISSVC